MDSVDSSAELGSYLDANDVEAKSKVQERAGSGLRGGWYGLQAGAAAGSFAGPLGGLVGGVLGAGVGYALASRYGETVAGKLQNFGRDLLDLKTDQEFGDDDGKFGGFNPFSGDGT